LRITDTERSSFAVTTSRRPVAVDVPHGHVVHRAAGLERDARGESAGPIAAIEVQRRRAEIARVELGRKLQLPRTL
jgi:hypothetical protein